MNVCLAGISFRQDSPKVPGERVPALHGGYVFAQTWRRSGYQEYGWGRNRPLARLARDGNTHDMGQNRGMASNTPSIGPHIGKSPSPGGGDLPDPPYRKPVPPPAVNCPALLGAASCFNDLPLKEDLTISTGADYPVRAPPALQELWRPIAWLSQYSHLIHFHIKRP